MDKLLIVIPIILYLAVNLGVGVWVSREPKDDGTGKKKGFVNNYFIGGRSMGGFVLAMTLIATYTSASSFIGGPGVAYTKGLGWVYLSMIQVPTAFLTLGVLGKKFATIARKIEAVTVTDYLRVRYKNDFVVVVASVALVIFFVVTMVAQFVGGAVLFQSITGYSYITGLVLFGIIVIAYTTVGGFKAVVITDTIQGVVMVVGTVLILYCIIKAGGGLGSVIEKLNTVNPTWNEPTAGGTIPKPMMMSYWVLVGVGVLGLPQTTVRGMGFKDTKSMHNAMIYGTVVLGFLMIGMHIAGVFTGSVLPAGITNTDTVIPTVVLQIMHPVVAGLFLAAPLAAVMSTVSSMLILASAAIIKDIYLNYVSKDKDEANKPEFEKKLSKMSLISTAIIGVVVFIFAIQPPSLIVWINLFAFGGLEAAFFCPTVFGLYWKRANATGAIWSFIVGVASYFFLSITKITPYAINPIVPTLVLAIIAFVVGSYVGKKPDAETMDIFFSAKD